MQSRGQRPRAACRAAGGARTRSAAHKRRQPRCAPAGSRAAARRRRSWLERAQCAIHQRAQPPLRQAFGGRIDRRQGLRQWLAQARRRDGTRDARSRVPSGPRAPRRGSAAACRAPGLRAARWRNRRIAASASPDAVGQAAPAAAAAAEDDLGQQDLAFDHGAHAGAAVRRSAPRACDPRSAAAARTAGPRGCSHAEARERLLRASRRRRVELRGATGCGCDGRAACTARFRRD